MKKNQKLMGQGTDFIVNGLTLAEAGTAPRITASGVGDNVYGIKLGKGELPNYAVVGTLEIKGITIQNVGGGQLKITQAVVFTVTIYKVQLLSKT